MFIDKAAHYTNTCNSLLNKASSLFTVVASSASINAIIIMYNEIIINKVIINKTFSELLLIVD